MTNMNTNSMTTEDRARVMEAIERRHSVRSYTGAHVDAVARRALEAEIAACNAEGGFHLQLVCDEDQAFSGRMAKYGRFENVRNYIACIGPKGPDLDEKLGYYGERVVLLAQTLGLNTCWVALTFSKGKSREVCEIGSNEKLVCVISIGYGTTQGKSHKIKTADQVSGVGAVAPAASSGAGAGANGHADADGGAAGSEAADAGADAGQVAERRMSRRMVPRHPLTYAAARTRCLRGSQAACVLHFWLRRPSTSRSSC